MKILNLTLGKDFCNEQQISAVLISDNNGTPLIGIEEQRGVLIAVYSYKDTDKFASFLQKHGLDIPVPTTSKAEL